MSIIDATSPTMAVGNPQSTWQLSPHGEWPDHASIRHLTRVLYGCGLIAHSSHRLEDKLRYILCAQHLAYWLANRTGYPEKPAPAGHAGSCLTRRLPWTHPCPDRLSGSLLPGRQ